MFTDKGYTGKDDIWVSVGDPTSDRVYEGTAPPRFTKTNRIYYGDAFVPESPSQQSLSGIEKLKQGFGFSQPTTLSSAPFNMRATQPQRKRMEIVLDGAYDDPNVENLSGSFYTDWAKRQAGSSNVEKLPNATSLVAQESKQQAATPPVQASPMSIAQAMASGSMQTKDNRYKDLLPQQRSGVTNYVGRR